MITSTKQAYKVLSARLPLLPKDEFEEALGWIVDWLGRIYAEPDKHIPCAKCGEDCDDSFMLHNDLWKEIWPTRRGELHLKCVEELLGRKLTTRDFKPIPMNASILYFLGSEK